VRGRWTNVGAAIWSGLEADLRRRVGGEVRFDAGAKALYATDLSIYHLVPIGGVIPRDADDVIATVAACREHDVPLLISESPALGQAAFQRKRRPGRAGRTPPSRRDASAIICAISTS
jgi:hypothetical protein